MSNKTVVDKRRIGSSFDLAAFSEQLKAEFLLDILAIQCQHTDSPLAYGYDEFLDNQYNGFSKKLKPTEKEKSFGRQEAARVKYRSVVEHLDRWSDWSGPDRVLPNTRSKDQSIELVLLRARAWVQEIIGDIPSLTELFPHARHSNGATKGCSYIETSVSAKMRPESLTCTAKLLPLWKAYCMWDTTLVEDFRLVNPSLVSEDGVIQCVLVDYLDLVMVAKDDEIDRAICPDTTIGMFFQQMVMRYLAKRLKIYGIDLKRQQDIHRYEAYIASITRRKATIDFTSASDTVGRHLVKYLFSSCWYGFLESMTLNRVKVGSDILSVNSFSTMGNAVTFPLESIVFYALVLAAEDTIFFPGFSTLPHREIKRTCSVFGDDCILDVKAADLFIEVCTSVGLIVNRKKSFYTDECFRESCGVDFLDGRNIRPFFLKGPRSARKSCIRAFLYSVWNGLLSVLQRVDPPKYAYRFERTLSFLARVLSHHNRELLVVVDSDPDDSGLKLFGDYHRLSGYFANIPFAPVFCDIHGTLKYQKLISVSDNSGIVTAPIEYWFCLKTMHERSRQLPRTYYYNRLLWGPSGLLMHHGYYSMSSRTHITLSRSGKVKIKVERLENVRRLERGYRVSDATNCGAWRLNLSGVPVPYENA